MMKICEDELCTGCCACLNICPKAAISMVEDNFGFNHPYIDNNICIDCGLCQKVCPIHNKPQKRKELITFAAISKDVNIYKSSTSGGIATTLSQYIISTGGVVYGVAFDDKFNLKHKRVDNIKDIPTLQGSKYVQSAIEYTFKQIKSELPQRRILFIGTPCQVAGLINYIPTKLQTNLTTISFICGGVPSIKFLKQNLTPFLNDAQSLKFRNGEKYGFWIKKTDNTVIYLKRFYSHYFRAFDNKISLRHSCYNCQLACQERIGDITIGDFWGLNKGELIKKADKGISIIICSTNKGKKIIEETQSYLFLERHDIAETLDMNPRLSSPPEISKAVWKFRQAYLNTKDFNKSVNSVLGMKYKIYAIKRKLKKITVLDYLYSLIKKM